MSKPVDSMPRFAPPRSCRGQPSLVGNGLASPPARGCGLLIGTTLEATPAVVTPGVNSASRPAPRPSAASVSSAPASCPTLHYHQSRTRHGARPRSPLARVRVVHGERHVQDAAHVLYGIATGRLADPLGGALPRGPHSPPWPAAAPIATRWAGSRRRWLLPRQARAGAGPAPVPHPAFARPWRRCRRRRRSGYARCPARAGFLFRPGVGSFGQK